ncbi:MAG: hypothetical protein OEM82_09660 [Acidobacteriota bacterium]|nr:hypothetical protein [Acidobacteriota bacterium]
MIGEAVASALDEGFDFERPHVHLQSERQEAAATDHLAVLVRLGADRLEHICRLFCLDMVGKALDCI